MRLLLLCLCLLLSGSLSNPVHSKPAELQPDEVPRFKAEHNSTSKIIPIPFPPILFVFYPSGVLGRWSMNFDGRSGELVFSSTSAGPATGTYRCDGLPTGPLFLAQSTIYYTLQNLVFYNDETPNKDPNQWFVSFIVNDTQQTKKTWIFYAQLDADVANMHGQVYVAGEAPFPSMHYFHASKATYATDNGIFQIGVPAGILGNWAFLRFGSPGLLTLTGQQLSYALGGSIKGMWQNIRYPDTTPFTVAQSSAAGLRYGSWWMYLLFWEGSTSHEVFLLFNTDLTHGHGVLTTGGSITGVAFDMTKAGNTEVSAASVAIGNWAFLVKGEPGTFDITGLDSNGQVTISGTQEYSPGTQLGQSINFITYPMKNIYYTEYAPGWGTYYLEWQYHWTDNGADRFFFGILDYKRKTVYGSEQNSGIWSARAF